MQIATTNNAIKQCLMRENPDILTRFCYDKSDNAITYLTTKNI